ncbi:hypothetical protein NLJ89_g437 [Agrocybe chaxingu]|uniref:Cytochrome P450 n=1 Tax=Agrocybe chaxingu TaxID=84603 RepID=A0A9W8N204_9AGAR|nr:hypothetical protein NLJ89_g437 [Agrocybe chaxingu]
MNPSLYLVDAWIHYIQASFIPGSVLLALAVFSLAIRRIFFHPLSKFPGPWLAAVTSMYKTYYEVVEGGELLHTIHRLHAMHGSVIRIGPNELHFNDPAAYHEIYSVGSRLTKDPSFYFCFNASDSAFGVIDPNESKARRGAMHPFFSRRAVLELENIIELLVHKLGKRGENPANMFLAFRSATLDVITSYMFGHCLDALDHPDFSAPLLLSIQDALPLLWLIKSFPWMIYFLQLVPDQLQWRITNQFRAFLEIRTFIITWLDRASREVHDSSEPGTPTICHRFFDNLTTESQTVAHPKAFIDESLSLLQAGSDTVGNVCTVGTFFVLNDKTVLSRLREELEAVWPDQDDSIDLRVLQNLPYLTAIVKESLRLSHGFVTPLPRIVGPSGATIAGHHIPPTTTVGMSVTAVHMSPSVFENPDLFIPERWLGKAQNLDRFLVAFSKGPRMCLGMRRLELEIVETRSGKPTFQYILLISSQYR